MKRKLFLLLCALLTMIGVQAQNWTGNTPAEGTFFLYNVEAQKFLNNGDPNESWGTNAYLQAGFGMDIKLEASGAAFNLNTNVSNGGNNNYLATSTWCDGGATPWTFVAVDGQANTYTIENGGKCLVANDALNDVEYKASTGDAKSWWKLVSLDDFKAAMAAKVYSTTDPMDVSVFISGRSFARNDGRNNTWVTSHSGGNWDFIGGADNKYYGNEAWNNTFDVHQEITGLPAGTYKLSCSGFGTNGTTYIYGTTGGVTTQNLISSDNATSRGTSKANKWAAIQLDNAFAGQDTDPFVVANGKLTVGIKRNNNTGGDWCIWDEFRLYYYGLDLSELVAAYESALSAAKTLSGTTKKMSDIALTSLNNTIDTYDEGKVDMTSQTALTTATNALSNAMDFANTSITSYDIIATGSVPDDQINGWVCENTNDFHINTWSNEGNSDGSNMKTPFIENWVAKGAFLGAGKVYYQLQGLNPGEVYYAQALVRSYNEASADAPNGPNFFINDKVVDMTDEGTTFTYNNMSGIYATLGGAATVGEDGVLKLGVDIAEDRNYNWVAFKSISIRPMSDAWNEATSAAKAVDQSKPMNAAVLATLQSAISTYGTTEPTTAEGYEEAIATLSLATINAGNSIVNYEEALAILNAASTLDADGKAAYSADENVAALQSAYNEGTLEIVSSEQKTAASAALIAAIKAQTTAGSDWTALITNPSFETGDFSGWTNTGMVIQGNTSFEKDGNNYVEKWEPNGTFSVKQTVNAMKAGVYRLSAKSKARGVTSAKIFANGIDKAITVQDASADYSVEFACDDNANVEIGFEGVGTGAGSSWLCVDNFTLKLVSAGLPDVTPVVGKMNAAVATAQTEAVAAYEAERTVANYNAAAAAVAAAQASVDAYAGVSAVISAANDIKTNHNFATAEAIEAFTSAIAAVSGGFEAGTLTNEEAANAGTTLGTAISGWRGNAAGAASKYLSNGFGLNEFDAALYVNTWSTEGETDGSNFKVPFYEYWTGDANSLGANTWTGTIDVPNGQYKISALVRVRAKNGVAAADANGITMTVTDGDAVDVTEGTQVGESQFQLKEYEAVGLVKDGKLIFNMVIAADNNISWLSFKNVKYEKLRDLTPEESAIVPADLVLDATKTVFRAKAVTLTPTSSTEGASIEGYTTWTSDNTDVATVDANGVVTGVGYGTANITVTSTLNASATATCAVTVDAPAVAELENIDFTDGPVVVAHIRTYAKDKKGTDVAQMQPVSGWAMAVANGDARAAGVMAYGSSYGMGSDDASFYAPATNPEGEASGNALGMVGVWTGSVQYVQYVKLAPGAYTVTVPVYRNGGASALTKNLIGVILDDNTEYLAKTTVYAANEWTTEKITFAVESETYAKLSVGLNAPDMGSGSSQRLWIDGFKIECEPFATDEEYAALNAAIEAAEAKTLGFEEGEYAPYNNVEACAALANAKAVSSGKGSSSAVVAATTALTDAAWTANTEEVNAIFDGSFEYDYRATTPSGNINPIGWRQTSTSGENATNVRYMDGGNAGLAATTSGKALFAKFSSYYGYVENYQMPLKANTLYRISFVYGGWGDCKKDGYVQVLGPDGTSVELSASELPLDAVDADANADSWKEYTAEFMTNEAGNYVLGFLRTQATQSQYVFGDIVLKKVKKYAITVADTENGTVVADKAEAAEGETVTLTATPAANYQFAGAYYMLNEEKVDITIDGNTASFAMPAAAVNVIATFEQQTDFTDRIVNANLTGTDPKGFDDAGTKFIDGSGIVKAGNNAQFDFKQTISLPAGQYKLTAQAAYRFGGSEADEAAAIVNGETTKFASLYATIGEKTVSTLVQNRYDGASETDYAAGSGSVVVNEKYVPNSSAAVQAWFNAGQYVNELVFNLSADGDVTIGIAKDAQPAAGDYTVIGPWTLTRLGDPVTMYAITVGETVNGSVSVDKTEAASGETVTVTVTPDAGYELDFLGYSRGMIGVMIPVENNVGTFTMPAGDVTVNASFKEVEDLSYKFVPSEWIAGDGARISSENVVADDEAGTITVDKSGANNVALLFRSAKTYEVKAEQRYFVIKATGLSTDEAASYLWWLNNTNNGSQIKPTSIYEEEGKTVFAWDCVTIPIGGKLGIEDTEFTDQGGWSTTFGMTLADDAVPAVISYIGFQESIPEPVEEFAYEFVPSEWVAGDAGRISPENVTADDDMRTITVNKTGDNNVALLFKTSKTYYVENIEYFYIKAKGISTAEGASYLWWLNGKNDGGKQFAPTHIKTEADGTIILEWRIDECGNIGENISASGKSYLAGGDGWNTTFGLTQADDTVPVVITEIGYSNDSPTGISSIESENAEGALKDGKYLIGGKIVIVKNGKQYNAAGQLK